MYELKRLSLTEAEKEVNQAERRYIGQDPHELGIEPKIRSVVIALVAHGFPTQNSCEGHLNGFNIYPWVRLEPITREGATRGQMLEHVKRIRYEHEKLSELAGDFWHHAPRPSPDREIVASLEWDPHQQSDEEVADEYLAERAQHFVAMPGYMLECKGAELLPQLPGEMIAPFKEQILANRQLDMLEFAEFLVSKL